jgi:hypothetical protein
MIPDAPVYCVENTGENRALPEGDVDQAQRTSRDGVDFLVNGAAGDGALHDADT